MADFKLICLVNHIKVNSRWLERIGLKEGEGIMQMASAPDPMDERNSMMENLI